MCDPSAPVPGLRAPGSGSPCRTPTATPESQTSRFLLSSTKFKIFCNFSQSRLPLPRGKGVLSFFLKGCFIRQGMMCSTSQQAGRSTGDTQKVTTTNSKQLLWHGQKHLVQKRLIRDENWHKRQRNPQPTGN